MESVPGLCERHSFHRNGRFFVAAIFILVLAKLVLRRKEAFLQFLCNAVRWYGRNAPITEVANQSEIFSAQCGILCWCDLVGMHIGRTVLRSHFSTTIFYSILALSECGIACQWNSTWDWKSLNRCHDVQDMKNFDLKSTRDWRISIVCSFAISNHLFCRFRDFVWMNKKRIGGTRYTVASGLIRFPATSCVYKFTRLSWSESAA